MISFIVNGEAVAKGRPKFSSRGGFVKAYTPRKTRDYEQKVAEAFNEAHPNVFYADEPLVLYVTVYKSIPKSYTKKQRAAIADGTLQPTGRPDLDNYIKSVSDGLNGVAFTDDSQIVMVQASKEYCDGESKVVVSLGRCDKVLPF